MYNYIFYLGCGIIGPQAVSSCIPHLDQAFFSLFSKSPLLCYVFELCYCYHFSSLLSVHLCPIPLPTNEYENTMTFTKYKRTSPELKTALRMVPKERDMGKLFFFHSAGK